MLLFAFSNGAAGEVAGDLPAHRLWKVKQDAYKRSKSPRGEADARACRGSKICCHAVKGLALLSAYLLGPNPNRQSSVNLRTLLLGGMSRSQNRPHATMQQATMQHAACNALPSGVAPVRIPFTYLMTVTTVCLQFYRILATSFRRLCHIFSQFCANFVYLTFRCYAS